MPEWEYLATEPFQMRYVMAASIVDRDCIHVVEIGPYQSRISDFLRSAHLSVTMVGPSRYTSASVYDDHRLGKVLILPGDFQDRLDMLPESNFGLVALGLEIKGDFDPFIELVDKSVLTIVEFPVGWETSEQQFERIMTESNKHIRMQIGLDFSGNDFSECSGYPVRPHRVMYVLR